MAKRQSMRITTEERTLVTMYRALARWDRTFYFLILQSLAWGKLTGLTDKKSFHEIVKGSDLPKAASPSGSD